MFLTFYALYCSMTALSNEYLHFLCFMHYTTAQQQQENSMNISLQVGMAATLAGVCKVPLTSVLLLFELTQDYRIVLPLLGAVGLSSWIASPQRFSKSIKSQLNSKEEKSSIAQQAANVQSQNKQVSSVETTDSSQEMCAIESSLCVYDAKDENVLEDLTVAEAMKTSYLSVSMATPLAEALNLMFVEKQPFVVITESDTSLIGLLELKHIQDFCISAKTIRLLAEVRMPALLIIFCIIHRSTY
jgi:hypothetical protein